MSKRNTALLCAVSAAAWLAIPMVVQAQNYDDPIISLPPPEQGGDDSGGGSGSGGSNGGGQEQPLPEPPTGSVETGHLTDATGERATITLDNKALQFESAGRRRGSGLEYDAGLDSAQGGGSNGGFPYWEGNGDWQVTNPATCEVAGYQRMREVDGTKEQSFSCYIEWMEGNPRQYVDIAHCLAGANNTKLDATRAVVNENNHIRNNDITSEDSIRYHPGTCPHPEWVTGSWSSWRNTSDWYRSSAHSGRTCGNVTEYRNQSRTRSASCRNGTNAECTRFNGPIQTTDSRRISRSRNLGQCGLYSRIATVTDYSDSYQDCHENRHQTVCKTRYRTRQHISFGFTFEGHNCRFLAKGYNGPMMKASVDCDGTNSGNTLQKVGSIRIGTKVLHLEDRDWTYTRESYRSCTNNMGERVCRTYYRDPVRSGYQAEFEGDGVNYISGHTGRSLKIELLP